MKPLGEVEKFILRLVQPMIGAGVIMDHWFQITEAGNLAMATLWLLVIATFLLIANKEDFLDDKEISLSAYDKGRNRIYLIANTFILFAAGWFISAIALLLAALVWNFQRQS